MLWKIADGVPNSRAAPDQTGPLNHIYSVCLKNIGSLLYEDSLVYLSLLNTLIFSPVLVIYKTSGKTY